MKEIFLSITNFLIFQRKFVKRLIIFVVDINLLFSSFILSGWIINQNNLIDRDDIFLAFLFSLLGVFIFFVTGKYKEIIRYVGIKTLYGISVRTIIPLLIIYFLSFFLLKNNLSLKHILIIWIISSGIIAFVRIAFKDILTFAKWLEIEKHPNVGIYGAGSAGAQLQASISIAKNYNVKAFFDDSKYLVGSKIDGIRIFSSNKIKDQIKIKNLNKILLAMPSIKKSRKREIIDEIANLGLEVLEVPSVDEITKKGIRVNALRNIEIDQLLFGREKFIKKNDLYKEELKDKVICVTGAGGSIGKELCNQIIDSKPRKLILIENNEHSLYLVNKFLLEKLSNIEVTPILGDLKNKKLIGEIFQKEDIQIIFHAAAYKHVPLVEINPIEGLENNIISTLFLCQLSKKFKIEKFILISSDKAVRPTNVMGASKRVSELIVQAFSSEVQLSRKNNFGHVEGETCFAMVRFGNVLGSSGSVVPLFREQIKSGGPITLTHEDIHRFFMTIQEASQLVLNASYLAKGGELFLLDMGEPIKILELAKKMINLSGLTYRDKDNPNGDIEIIQKGLRPGEKLFEELLIDSDAEKTSNSLIFKAQESFIPYKELIDKIFLLKGFLKKRDKEAVFKIIAQLVPEWKQYNFED